MFKKGSKFYSILFNKCPKCQQGDFMKGKNLFNLKTAFTMNTHCSHCGLKYMLEPSFFYGAMYVSYALTVGISISTFTIATLLFDLSYIESLAPILIMLILTAPVTLRFSRIIWINIFVSYNPISNKDSKNVQL